MLVAKTTTITKAIEPIDTNTCPIKKQKTPECRRCGLLLGNGPGMHPRGACPQLTEEQKELILEKKILEADEKMQYKMEKQRRQAVARHNIDNNLLPGLKATVVKRRNTPGDVFCPIFLYRYDRGLPTSDPNWHFVRNRRMTYCPWADPPTIKSDILCHQESMRALKNSKKRAARNN